MRCVLSLIARATVHQSAVARLSCTSSNPPMNVLHIEEFFCLGPRMAQREEWFGITPAVPRTGRVRSPNDIEFIAPVFCYGTLHDGHGIDKSPDWVSHHPFQGPLKRR